MNTYQQNIKVNGTAQKAPKTATRASGKDVGGGGELNERGRGMN